MLRLSKKADYALMAVKHLAERPSSPSTSAREIAEQYDIPIELMAKVLQRTQGVDLNAARAAAAERPDDVEAQTLVADLDLLGGHVDDAFRRLVELVRRTSEAERDQARSHLIGLFAAVGNDDPRVLAARRNLASALF